jgi:hypothetical protein
VPELSGALWKLASARSVENGPDQDAEVAFVDAGDGVALLIRRTRPGSTKIDVSDNRV